MEVKIMEVKIMEVKIMEVKIIWIPFKVYEVADGSILAWHGIQQVRASVWVLQLLVLGVGKNCVITKVI
jgi:hypothetical protein